MDSVITDIRRICKDLDIICGYNVESHSYIFKRKNLRDEENFSDLLDHVFMKTINQLTVSEELIRFWGVERLARVLYKFKVTGSLND